MRVIQPSVTTRRTVVGLDEHARDEVISAFGPLRTFTPMAIQSLRFWAHYLDSVAGGFFDGGLPSRAMLSVAALETAPTSVWI